MKWITNLFRRRATSGNGAVVFLDTDILSKEDIKKIKVRMTPVFVEFSGREMEFGQFNVKESVIPVGEQKQ